MRINPWIALADKKPMAGTYLVGLERSVAQARYMPRNDRWVFPSAQMSFVPTHWMHLPEGPAAYAPTATGGEGR